MDALTNIHQEYIKNVTNQFRSVPAAVTTSNPSYQWPSSPILPPISSRTPHLVPETNVPTNSTSSVCITPATTTGLNTTVIFTNQTNITHNASNNTYNNSINDSRIVTSASNTSFSNSSETTANSSIPTSNRTYS
ncbi:GATA zinc finger domain-containing protein 12-like [Contarinia nasturtii]|uniref:GATA zinc finger domain-containing protein 12-like n=1 Tax=Contarinia nasturtii TaxID=265458 RepID=UPI0012D420E0|nr:GATA zinc finger domain-containing protein 12-like [Contarinia nasturtii]